jgi:hypothetical protein
VQTETAVQAIQAAVPRGPVRAHPERTIPAGGRWPLTAPGTCSNCDQPEAVVGALLWTPCAIPLCTPCYRAVAVDPVTGADLLGALGDREPEDWGHDVGTRGV